MSQIQSHRDLKVWQLGIELTTRIYALTAHFPHSENFGLSSQLKRAAVSVPSNIAEGNSRKSTKEYLHFLAIAIGSLAEIDTQLEIARQLEFGSPWSIDELSNQAQELCRMLHGLRASLTKKLNNQPDL